MGIVKTSFDIAINTEKHRFSERSIQDHCAILGKRFNLHSRKSLKILCSYMHQGRSKA